MTAMPSIPGGLTWDPQDRLQKTDHQGGGITYYVYDSSGIRARKVHVNQAGTTSKERLYLGPWETYRETTDLLGTPTLDLERETLHVQTEAGDACLLETKTLENAATIQNPTTHQRYQHHNHLGTATVELTAAAEVISYEEYHPYGTSAYRAANSAVDVSAKRYRYTGKERDEESGLYYHEARYYGCWLARWVAADPIGIGDGPNRFAYVDGHPTRHIDKTGTRKTRFGEARQYFKSEMKRRLSGFERRLLRRSVRRGTTENYLLALKSTESPLSESERIGAFLSPGSVEQMEGLSSDDRDKITNREDVLPLQASSVRDFSPFGKDDKNHDRAAATESRIAIVPFSEHRYRIHVFARRMDPTKIENVVSPDSPETRPSDDLRMSQSVMLSHENWHPRLRVSLAAFANRMAIEVQKNGELDRNADDKLLRLQEAARIPLNKKFHNAIDDVFVSRAERRASRAMRRLEDAPLRNSGRQATKADEMARRALLRQAVQ